LPRYFTERTRSIVVAVGVLVTLGSGEKEKAISLFQGETLVSLIVVVQQ